MKLALNEAKTQAKILFKALKYNKTLFNSMRMPLTKVSVISLEQLKLKHCLTLIAHQLGFENWHQAQLVLSGNNDFEKPFNMGTFFYLASCGAFLNEWFVNYQQAYEALQNQQYDKWLLPYKNQFIVVDQNYIASLQLEENLVNFGAEIPYNMVESYCSEAWDKIACAVIKNRPRNY